MRIDHSFVVTGLVGRNTNFWRALTNTDMETGMLAEEHTMMGDGG